jgi:hypothetical protein
MRNNNFRCKTWVHTRRQDKYAPTHLASDTFSSVFRVRAFFCLCDIQAHVHHLLATTGHTTHGARHTHPVTSGVPGKEA